MRRNKSGVYQADGVKVREAGLKILLHLSNNGTTWTWQPLPERVHTLALRALYERDLIASDKGGLYRITYRGLKYLQALDETARRHDGICPCCGERPRGVTSGGRRLAYCKPCHFQKRDETTRRAKIRRVVARLGGRR